MRQRWEDLLFLHWEVGASEIQNTLPPGLTVDLHGDKAYLAIVPFKMRAIRPAGLPSVPYLSNFLECNVRTYVHDERGEPGVWFYSLDTDRWIAHWIARTFFKLPYVWSAMGQETAPDGAIRYSVRRRDLNEECRYHFLPNAELTEAAPGSLEYFLLERYLLYSYDPDKDQLYRGRVHHKPYAYRAVNVDHADSELIKWNSLSLPSGPAVHQCFSPGVEVEVFPLEGVSR